MDSVAPQSYRMLNENLSARHWIPLLYECLVREALATLKQQTITIVPGLPPKLDGKSSVLQIPHTWVAGHGEINLKPDGNIPSDGALSLRQKMLCTFLG